MAKARHISAGIKRFGVIDLAPGVLHNCFRVPAELTEVVEARAQCAVRNFLFADLMTVIAIPAVRRRRGVAVGTAATPLGTAVSFTYPDFPKTLDFS